MVGSAVCRKLRADHPEVRLITRPRSELDLSDYDAVRLFLEEEKPQAIVFAAARVGGIEANRRFPVEFMSDNLRAQLATITAAYDTGVQRLLFLGSTCIYPRHAAQPIREDALLTGPLEPTNEAYALAKICGLKLCQFYRRQYGVLYHSVMPTNLYGPGDNYHPEHSHVLPALLRRIHEAKEANAAEVVIWGTGKPRREFLHVDDLAAAIVHLLNVEDPPDWVNVGTGVDLSILELAQLIADIVGFRGRIVTDPSMPDGMPQKLTDISRIRRLGWEPRITLADGIRRTYHEFLRSIDEGALRSI